MLFESATCHLSSVDRLPFFTDMVRRWSLELKNYFIAMFADGELILLTKMLYFIGLLRVHVQLFRIGKGVD